MLEANGYYIRDIKKNISPAEEVFANSKELLMKTLSGNGKKTFDMERGMMCFRDLAYAGI
jgi:hypothetical protein